MADHIPTVRQRRLAQALRELRHEAGLTQDAVAARMGWHTSKLFRLENARSPQVDWLDVRELLDMYRVTNPDREALIQLARNARMIGWWTPYRDVFTGSYVALEVEASAMRLYCPELVPGLLQTGDYARTVIRAVRPGYDAESVERRVTARLARQKVLLDRVTPPELLVVLNEAVLHRQVGTAHIMAAQLRALADAAERPQITLQVLPFSAGAHAGLEGGFVLIEFPSEQDPDVVYVEGMMGDVYLESVEEVKRYQSAFECIQAIALSPGKSKATISALELLAPPIQGISRQRHSRTPRSRGGQRHKRRGAAVMGKTGTARPWRKSSHSGGDNNCVEVATSGGDVTVRDSKHRQEGALSFAPAAWQAFTTAIGEASRPG
jgi:hypothetical protein